MRRLFLLWIIITCIGTSEGKNPFARYGYLVKEATMSNGKYEEFHDTERYVVIGSVLFDTKTETVVGRAATDTSAPAPHTISRYISIDPEAERYYSISPYAYCKNNPVRYVDTDGKKIIDAKGNTITYSKESGWSNNATKDVIRIGNAMMKSSSGTTYLEGMINSKLPISMDISSEPRTENDNYILGVANKKTIINKKTKEIKVEKIEIILYEGSIEASSAYEGLKKDEKIGAVASHESGHTTAENINHSLKGENPEEREKEPNNRENTYIKEIKENQKQR